MQYLCDVVLPFLVVFPMHSDKQRLVEATYDTYYTRLGFIPPLTSTSSSSSSRGGGSDGGCAFCLKTIFHVKCINN